jgi:hypothetical protein
VRSMATICVHIGRDNDLAFLFTLVNLLLVVLIVISIVLLISDSSHIACRFLQDYCDLRDAISIEKRYFTSARESRS